MFSWFIFKFKLMAWLPRRDLLAPSPMLLGAARNGGMVSGGLQQPRYGAGVMEINHFF